MKKIVFYISALVLMVVLATGCAKLPQVELDAAKASLESAKLVDANRYFPTEFNVLQDSLNAVTVALETEKSKTFFSRSYDVITEKLVKISADAEVLKSNVEERKAQVRAEVQESLVALTSLIDADKALLLKAPKGKEGKAALEAIQTDITVIEASVNEINTLISNGDYITAQDKVNASKTKAEAIKAELETAIAKVRKR
ncbi:MAG: hypothetical protein RBR68_04565 [Tenuifilaceae bacterium]|jgi:hypothetical protein|nr:hypothetical protein [Tenuifilaceae bacterium]